MSVTYYPPRPAVPLEQTDSAQHRRALASTTNFLLAGHNSATMAVTLATGAATTAITDPRISMQTVVAMVPSTADAAAETGRWITVSKGQAVIHHSTSAVADRTFQVALIG
jgi:hypothetical protein